MIATMFTALWLLSLVVVCTQFLRFVLIASLWASGSLADILPEDPRISSSDPRVGARAPRRRNAASNAIGTLRRRAFEDETSVRLQA